MNSGKWFAVLSICALAALVDLAEGTNVSAAQSAAATNTSMQLLGRYHGVLPCADCPGITTTLSLSTKSPDDLTHTRYVLKRTYQDRANTLTETGTWTVVRGTPDDPNATVYQLKPGDGSQVTNFLKVSDDELLQLDNERRHIDSNLNFSLKKIAAKPSPKPASQE